MEEIRWYVLGSLSRNQELKIRDDLRRDSYDCFVPLRYVVKTIKGHRQRTMVPALSGLMFIKGSLEELKEVLRYRKHGLYLRKSTFTNKEEYLTVSDHDMQNFIAVTEKAGEKITYYSPDEIQLRPGDMIRVSGGLYDGREGMIMRVKGKRKKQFVVSIPGVLVAAVEIEPELVEVLSEKSEQEKSSLSNRKSSALKSMDVDEDQRLLIKFAKRLLLDIPEAYQHEKEYYLMLSEMKHVASRLSSVKAYIPSREAELALSLYLAAVKLQQDIESASQRLRTAIDKLQPTSLIKLCCQMYLAHFSGDVDLQTLVEDRIAAIKSHPLSINQRLLLEEFESLQNSHKIV